MPYTTIKTKELLGQLSGESQTVDDLAVGGDVTVTGSTVIATEAPAAADSTGVAGTITWADGFIYVCIATDTWQRVAIATWA